MTIDLSIIIVSWNVREHLERCLASLEKHLTPRSQSSALARGKPALSSKERGIEVFVVDNASTDGTQAMLASVKVSEYQSVRVICNKENLGFARANNQAIAKAQGKYILLLNPDTELQPHLNPLLAGEEERVSPLLEGEGRVRSPLEAMLRFMESHPRCGIVGPRLVNDDGTLQPSVRRFPRALDPLLFSLGLARRYCAADFDYTKAQAVDQVMGAAFLIRRELIDAIGMLDERFFIWFEEVDYCKRAKEAGWEVWYTPDANVLHHGGKSFVQVMTAKKQWIYSRSLLQYFWKHGQWGAFLFNALLVPVRLFFSIIHLTLPSPVRRGK